jgi:hypothetical protein
MQEQELGQILPARLDIEAFEPLRSDLYEGDRSPRTIGV